MLVVLGMLCNGVFILLNSINLLGMENNDEIVLWLEEINLNFFVLGIEYKVRVE